jgi:hypothetical protein
VTATERNIAKSKREWFQENSDGQSLSEAIHRTAFDRVLMDKDMSNLTPALRGPIWPARGSPATLRGQTWEIQAQSLQGVVQARGSNDGGTCQSAGEGAWAWSTSSNEPETPSWPPNSPSSHEHFWDTGPGSEGGLREGRLENAGIGGEDGLREGCLENAGIGGEDGLREGRLENAGIGGEDGPGSEGASGASCPANPTGIARKALSTAPGPHRGTGDVTVESAELGHDGSDASVASAPSSSACTQPRQ